ncbi:MAG TPA: hypothetical protein VK172_13750 [Lentimicrobium sp.]|nr:hypothetical protein [Lentimicrobium sp.]
MSLLISCSKESGKADNLDICIDLKLESISGSDLLNPDTENSYNQEDIQLFYLLNGIEQYHFCGNCDHQKHYYFFERDNRFVMRISPSFVIQEDGSDPVTYVQWNDSDRDTLKCHIYRSDDGGNIVCTKVWYNDSLVYDNIGVRYFTIIK